MVVPALQSAFKLQMLDSKGRAVVIILGLTPFILNEIIKAIMRTVKK
jgi:hypothetical protein